MNESSWEQSKKRRTYRRIVVWGIVCIIGFVVGFNNRDALPIKKSLDFVKKIRGEKLPSSQTSKVDSLSNSKEFAQKDHSQHTDSAKTAPDSLDIVAPNANVKDVVAKADQSVVLAFVVCGIADKPNLRMTMTIECFFAHEKYRQEIMFKRQELRALCNGVLSKLTLSEMKPDKMAPLVTSALNSILSDSPLLESRISDCAVTVENKQ